MRYEDAVKAKHLEDCGTWQLKSCTCGLTALREALRKMQRKAKK